MARQAPEQCCAWDEPVKGLLHSSQWRSWGIHSLKPQARRPL